jgi:hypothetical protein
MVKLILISFFYHNLLFLMKHLKLNKENERIKIRIKNEKTGKFSQSRYLQPR